MLYYYYNVIISVYLCTLIVAQDNTLYISQYVIKYSNSSKEIYTFRNINNYSRVFPTV